MAPDVTAIERIAERPIGVDPAAIEDEFARIWRETSGAGYDESSVRLRVLNLVAVAQGRAAEAQFEQVMQVLPERHPCRGILAVTARDGGPIEASISAHCLRAPGGDLDVCSEEVVLIASQERQDELSSVVLALLVPEIPVALWLIGLPDPRAYVVAETAEAADSVLFDSAAGEEPAQGLRCGLELEKEHGTRVFDLAWGRTEPWRTLTAQLFDGDERLEELRRLREVEVRGGGGRRSAEVMLYGAWLVSRLGLSLADIDRDDGGLRATLYAGTRGVLLAVADEGAAGIARVVIRSDGAEFELACGAEASRHITVRERWADGESERMVEAPPTDDASIILRALGGAEEEGVYRDASAAALALLGE